MVDNKIIAIFYSYFYVKEHVQNCIIPRKYYTVSTNILYSLVHTSIYKFLFISFIKDFTYIVILYIVINCYILIIVSGFTYINYQNLPNMFDLLEH